MHYFQVNGGCLLLGSMRKDTPVQFTFFIRLLALCSQSRKWGVVCANDDEGYTATDLSELLHMPVSDIVGAIAYHTSKKRIETLAWGGIKVLNWDKYQNTGYSRVAKCRANKELQENVTQSVSPIERERERERENKEKENLKEKQKALEQKEALSSITKQITNKLRVP